MAGWADELAQAADPAAWLLAQDGLVTLTEGRIEVGETLFEPQIAPETRPIEEPDAPPGRALLAPRIPDVGPRNAGVTITVSGRITPYTAEL